MRHHNITRHTYTFHSTIGQVLDRPFPIRYNRSRLTFTRPKTSQYIYVLELLSTTPNITRREIIKHIWPDYYNSCINSPYSNSIRGYYSTVFSQLLYHDYIDYDKKFKYHITKKGLELLNRFKNG